MRRKKSPLDALEDASLLRTQALINGEWVAGQSQFAVTDPATGAHLADVANLGAIEAEAAIAAANNAWGPWRSKTAKERAAILLRWHQLLIKHTDDRQQQALSGDQAGDGCVCGNHALEFPDCDDHPQGGTGAGRRLHGGDQARGSNAAVGFGGG